MEYNVVVKFHQNIMEVNGNTITVGVRARPEKGRANEELVGKIARHFKVPRSRVRIVSGWTSKHKIIEVAVDNP